MDDEEDLAIIIIIIFLRDRPCNYMLAACAYIHELLSCACIDLEMALIVI